MIPSNVTKKEIHMKYRLLGNSRLEFQRQRSRVLS
jgi:hypothetical protein